MIFRAFKNLFDDGWTVYGSQSSGVGGDMLWVLFFVCAICCIGTMFTLGAGTVISILLVFLTLATRIAVNTKFETTIFTMLIHPVTLYCFKIAGGKAYASFHEGRLAPFIGAVVLFFIILLVSSIDYEYNFFTAMYAAITLIIMVIYANVQYPNGFVLTPLKMVMWMYAAAAVFTIVKVILNNLID